MLTDPVDRDLAHDLDLILSNQEDLRAKMTAACMESVIEDDASTNNIPDAYRSAHFWGNDDWYTFLNCAGMRIGDVVLDLIEAEVKEGFVYDMLTQRLDLGNRAVWADVAEGFMPDPDDVEEAMA